MPTEFVLATLKGGNRLNPCSHRATFDSGAVKLGAMSSGVADAPEAKLRKKTQPVLGAMSPSFPEITPSSQKIRASSEPKEASHLLVQSWVDRAWAVAVLYLMHL